MTQRVTLKFEQKILVLRLFLVSQLCSLQKELFSFFYWGVVRVHIKRILDTNKIWMKGMITYHSSVFTSWNSMCVLYTYLCDTTISLATITGIRFIIGNMISNFAVSLLIYPIHFRFIHPNKTCLCNS